MSSRALRRAQRELEERQRLENVGQHEEEASEEAVTSISKPKPSLFAMLGDVDEDEGGDEDEVEHQADAPDEAEEPNPVTTPATQPSKKSKKKKKKGKGKAPVKESDKKVMDEIDLSLLTLGLPTKKSKKSSSPGNPWKSLDLQSQLTSSNEMQQLFSALTVDNQHLHASNEMRKLFGRTAVQGGHDDDEPPRRQRGRGQQQAGFAAAIAGRNAPGHRNLVSLGLRRNIFIQGKEEWPRATSGGLGMEVVGKKDDGTVEYRFVHNTMYQSVQTQFETCVASMDPERMVQLLHHNPYHISTLLQVSEIAKQQRDNAASGDLLERALFSFGRAVHSTFANNLAQGKARLDFRRPENREFWLTVYRYIAMLGIRATWRTSFEWAKLLLSMDPEGDPYCVRLLIDQLALRGREPQSLVDLVEVDHLQRIWKIPPNLAMSVALAHDRLKQPEKARSTLCLAIEAYPWLAARLCKELEITPIPKAIWGKEPVGDEQELLCQLYVSRAKDLWNTPEATSLLVEVSYSFEATEANKSPRWFAPFDELNLARHVILSDDRNLLSLLDPRIKNKYTSSSDPLPPEDNNPSYTTIAQQPGIQNLNEHQLQSELEGLRDYFSDVDLERYIAIVGGNIDNLTPEVLDTALRAEGTSLEEFRRNTERVHTIRARLLQLGIEVVFDDGRNREVEDAEDTDSEDDE
ncbi:transcriptional repressor TCF25-domain-containing protein [Clohesyomyces aquaticus]|uniref:Transcriptional repressor TCF25-domain-containing protein n=1 Tax=Clohesyomyces aquaticus TaxID=1231657 RepID=A0A1Y1ZFA5_9PLEO|nr:transcriptional repressor TCF25-domain-containing protein [Clohesyomyces aquaticus]